MVHTSSEVRGGACVAEAPVLVRRSSHRVDSVVHSAHGVVGVAEVHRCVCVRRAAGGRRVHGRGGGGVCGGERVVRHALRVRRVRRVRRVLHRRSPRQRAQQARRPRREVLSSHASFRQEQA